MSDNQKIAELIDENRALRGAIDHIIANMITAQIELQAKLPKKRGRAEALPVFTLGVKE